MPFIKSWNPSARARFAGAPIRVNIEALEEGGQLREVWRGAPIFISRRSKALLDTLPQLNAAVVDPQSTNPDQTPAYARNQTRSIKPEILVLVGVCTHLGCAPEFLPQIQPQAFDANWKGGYFCPCHKSKYDAAGRVYLAQPAPAALPVPPHRFVDDNTIEIGVDQGAA